MRTSNAITIAIASIAAVLLAVSLVVASIAYFPATATVVSNTTTVTRTSQVTTTINVANMGNESCDQFLHLPWYLDLPSNATLKEDGTTMVGNTTYWYVSFILGNLTSVNFHGVNFEFNSSQPPTITGAEYILNDTMLTVSAVQYNSAGPGPAGCALYYYLPQITITFKNGASVIYNKEHITITKTSSMTTVNINYDKPLSNPWFTEHISPQAGIAYEPNGGQITLYVSKP